MIWVALQRQRLDELLGSIAFSARLNWRKKRREDRIAADSHEWVAKYIGSGSHESPRNQGESRVLGVAMQGQLSVRVPKGISVPNDPHLTRVTRAVPFLRTLVLRTELLKYLQLANEAGNELAWPWAVRTSKMKFTWSASPCLKDGAALKPIVSEEVHSERPWAGSVLYWGYSPVLCSGIGARIVMFG